VCELDLSTKIKSQRVHETIWHGPKKTGAQRFDDAVLSEIEVGQPS
jgi:hypothetical protein